jgi:hypothetical protein
MYMLWTLFAVLEIARLNLHYWFLFSHMLNVCEEVLWCCKNRSSYFESFSHSQRHEEVVFGMPSVSPTLVPGQLDGCHSYSVFINHRLVPGEHSACRNGDPQDGPQKENGDFLKKTPLIIFFLIFNKLTLTLPYIKLYMRGFFREMMVCTLGGPKAKRHFSRRGLHQY